MEVIKPGMRALGEGKEEFPIYWRKLSKIYEKKC
jgi:hypothetical protein